MHVITCPVASDIAPCHHLPGGHPTQLAHLLTSRCRVLSSYRHGRGCVADAPRPSVTPDVAPSRPAAAPRLSPCLATARSLLHLAVAPTDLQLSSPYPAPVDLPDSVDSSTIAAGPSSQPLISTWTSLPLCRHLLRSLSPLS